VHNYFSLSEEVEREQRGREMVKISLKTIGLTLRTSQLHRLLVYALVTAIIEVPSIIVLYSLGYPDNPYARTSTAYLIAVNLFIWFLVSSAISGPPPEGTSPSDLSILIGNPLFQLFAGVVCMFIIVTVIGEAIVWLNGEISKLTEKLATGEVENEEDKYHLVDRGWSSASLIFTVYA
jgi:hypothetical protein